MQESKELGVRSEECTRTVHCVDQNLVPNPLRSNSLPLALKSFVLKPFTPISLTPHSLLSLGSLLHLDSSLLAPNSLLERRSQIA